MKRWSLKRRLLSLLLILTALMWAISAVTIYWEASKESDELFDQALKESASLLLALGEREILDKSGARSASVIGSAAEGGAQYLHFQFWGNDGQLIYRNEGAPQTHFVKANEIGFGWATIEDQQWRTFSVWNKRASLNLQVGEPLKHRKEIGAAVAMRLALFALVALPLFAAMMWLLVGRLLSPVDRLSLLVAKRSATNLDQVLANDAPLEILPLVEGLNGLLTRMRRALEHERQFTADAAHELRTPLAAIRAHAQLVSRARSSEERQEAIADIIGGVDRGARVVDQLLTLARLEPEIAQSRASTTFDLGELLLRQIEAHADMASAKDVTLIYENRPLSMNANEHNVSMLTRNLIDNAIRYTQPGGCVEVCVIGTSQGIQLAVSDSGPGIPPALQERIFDRFYRISGSNQTGAGLGLSIVRRIVESECASISIERGIRGEGVGFIVTFRAR